MLLHFVWGLQVRVSCVRATAAPNDLREWAFDLVSKNMRELYEASQWGWSENAKRKELGHRDAWYLVAHLEEDNSPVGFIHFRFDMDGGMSLAAHFRMCKTVLTVFKSNTGALAFYQKALGYRTDETSPSGDAADYVILSRRTGVPAKR
ncbi:hypothetical protein MRX96_044660 [Rhipicephalus microplus]